jgi:GT2 family glycosyltransferase
MKTVSIIIPNWNGQELLQESIPALIEAVAICGDSCEIIVVDNASCDESRSYLRDNFPKIKIITLSKNYGFAIAMNTGIKTAANDIIIGLNSDVIVDKDFLHPLISHFDNNGGIFAVAAKMLLWDKKTLNFGRAVGRFKFGVFRRIFQQPAHPVNALYACGGAFAAKKEKFLELGGFDEDMLNFWEDLDLCYRAWKQGYKTIYEPKSIVYHKMHASFLKKYKIGQIARMSGENYFLFMLKNFHDKAFCLQQILFLPFLLFIAPFLGRANFSLGILRSIRRWPLFIRKRKAEKIKTVLSDKQIFMLLE